MKENILDALSVRKRERARENEMRDTSVGGSLPSIQWMLPRESIRENLEPEKERKKERDGYTLIALNSYGNGSY